MSALGGKADMDGRSDDLDPARSLIAELDCFPVERFNPAGKNHYLAPVAVGHGGK
jgi:hypothetical protein